MAELQPASPELDNSAVSWCRINPALDRMVALWRAHFVREKKSQTFSCGEKGIAYSARPRSILDSSLTIQLCDKK
jgi:hypothetical protein